MEARKKRLTLDLDPMVQRRLKAVAAMKGISMRQYCLTAIGRELSKDEDQGVMDLPFGHEALDRLDALRKEIFGDGVLPGDSVDFIREARERVLNGIVVGDASLAFKWLVREENSDRAQAISRSWADDGFQTAAPHLLPVEVVRDLHRRVLLGELTESLSAAYPSP